ncbi:Cu(I)-responsive transcriptional regulator [Pigmentiphaga sp.]|uniref:Cu(I)-responsive transcriptional regulator n=1 Tax=Pigmentiphaga sp. TaxID=1977564 RepID=UPI00128B3B74|nr:Cu(I)-responsive transcriptional regulator [Pigmentiphaga sp.]MPS27299.1 Cu(I)-responsive transcriptional regulator [Alcaligenaceae bacterium SAGV5]MPS51557.1 Cu(I)-responsive transcriptional regulator [Alcaligenaceae bacterium SAGV3]MPT59023.1 Cu(I)-responsive transcriptional regulator [Alcaligenaceae bacterium]
MQALNIGQASDVSGVSAKMIRHYEAIGLIPPAHRTDAGYRLYGESEVHTLQFIRNARDLGFSIPQIGTLLELWNDRSRPSVEVKRLACDHIGELDEKIRGLQAMKATLEQLASHCHGDHRPDCPILSGLATPGMGSRAATGGPASPPASGKR